MNPQESCHTASWAEEGEALVPDPLTLPALQPVFTLLSGVIRPCLQPVGPQPTGRLSAASRGKWGGHGVSAVGEPVPIAGPRAGVCESDRANFPNTI